MDRIREDRRRRFEMHDRLIDDEADRIEAVHGRAIGAGVDDPVALVIDRLDPLARLVAARLGDGAIPPSVIPAQRAVLVVLAPPRRRAVDAFGLILPRMPADIARIPPTARAVAIVVFGVGSARAIVPADSPPEAYMPAGGEGRRGGGGGRPEAPGIPPAKSAPVAALAVGTGTRASLRQAPGSRHRRRLGPPGAAGPGGRRAIRRRTRSRPRRSR